MKTVVTTTITTSCSTDSNNPLLLGMTFFYIKIFMYNIASAI